MLSKADKYRQMIQKATKRIILFSHVNNQEKKPTGKLECDIKLPSSYPFRSNEQIENNLPISYHIAHQQSQLYPISLHNQSPKPCIGLILCQHYQNNQTYYVYGTGILIHKNIVLTSAQNVYCRRLNTQYKNIRFIVGVYGDKCSGIYDVMRVHYSMEYTIQEGYDDYNFAVLSLYDDLSINCGYVGWKISEIIEEDEEYTVYGYTSSNQQGLIILSQLIKHGKQYYHMENRLRSGVLVKQNNQKCSLVGLQQSGKKYILSAEIRNRINSWTEKIDIDLSYNNIDVQGCKQLSQVNWSHLTQINLNNSNIGAQGCKYLIQANWSHLTNISLDNNNIGAQGCKYLTQANWKHLNMIDLRNNIIGVQGCKYLSQANWSHLRWIDLRNNNIGVQECNYLSQANWIYLNMIDLSDNGIDAQGCKYLSQANWIYLNMIDLTYNNIGAKGCEYLSQANWTHLNTINLIYNNIGAQGCKYLSQANWTLNTINLNRNQIGEQGCKYLSQANWTHLINIIYLDDNNIGAQGCKYLSQANWTLLTLINLKNNNIGAQGCKYLSQTNWSHLSFIKLQNNKINGIIDRLLLQQSYPKSTIHI